MGDHRFSFKAEFEMHGVKKTVNLAWLNWSGGHDGIDRRITEWIEAVRDAAMAKFDDEVAEYQAEQNRAVADPIGVMSTTVCSMK